MRSWDGKKIGTSNYNWILGYKFDEYTIKIINICYDLYDFYPEIRLYKTSLKCKY